MQGTDLVPPPAPPSAPVSRPVSALPTAGPSGRSQARPVSINELSKEKPPGTNAQRITLFAYYRDKHEGVSRFGRNDLKAYYAKAKEQPPGNYDRDFVEAVRNGWLHEDGDDSYITSKGIELVESAFAGERKYIKSAKTTRTQRRTPAKTKLKTGLQRKTRRKR